jgi:xanthosine utilization system XapX-like protein
MTMMGGRFPKGSDEVGQTVASFPSYEAAQKAVSSLIAADIPARDIAIVGQGLRSVERITGRLGYAAAARSGAVNGLLLGLLFSAILVIGSPSVPIQAFVGVLFVGIAIGMLMSIVAYSFVRRRRDYASVMQVVADHYEVTVTDNSLGRARQILGPQAASAPPPPVRPAEQIPDDLSEPPKYGERLAPASAPAPASDSAPGTSPEPDGTAPSGPAGAASPDTRADHGQVPHSEPSSPSTGPRENAGTDDGDRP